MFETIIKRPVSVTRILVWDSVPRKLGYAFNNSASKWRIERVVNALERKKVGITEKYFSNNF